MDSFLVEPTTTTAAASSAPPVPFDWWPPAEWLGDFMLAFHDTTSLGWIGTIMCFTVVVRVLVLPLVRPCFVFSSSFSSSSSYPSSIIVLINPSPSHQR